MPYLDPNSNQVKTIAALPAGQPLVMLNLLKYKELVEENGLTGKEQYKVYMKAVTPFLAKSKGEFLYNGPCLAIFIGPEEGLEWDKVLLVKYPDKDHFLEMIADPDYPSALRTIALADSRLIVCRG